MGSNPSSSAGPQRGPVEDEGTVGLSLLRLRRSAGHESLRQRLATAALACGHESLPHGGCSLAGANLSDDDDLAQPSSGPARLGVMNVIGAVLAITIFATWLSTVVHGLLSLTHLSGKSSFWQVISYAAWLDAENFTPRGQKIQRRFVRSFAAFACCFLVFFALIALKIWMHPAP